MRIFVLACALSALAMAPRLIADSGDVESKPTEAQSCLASQCHEYRMAFWTSPHSALDTAGLASRADATWSCAACHGEPRKSEKQAGEPGCPVDVFSFRPSDAPQKKTKRCLACHATDHPGFGSSEHARAGLDCTSCHSVHDAVTGRWSLQRESSFDQGNALRPASPAATCAGCHADVFADFEQNERHRLQEGIVLCSDCHDPHKRQNRLSLGGFKQEACAQCHRDKTGPFVFEHGASRAEGCVSCHTPHGTPNRHMLHFQSVAEACYSCHVAVPGFHSRFTLDSQCTNCHSAVHGSNLDAHFLR